jgi:hypothetical protein
LTGKTTRPDQDAVEILLEVAPRQESGDLSSRPALPENFRKRAAEIAASIGEVADEFRARLAQSITRPPSEGWGVDSIEIKFDINIQAGAGVLIAKASSGATFSARLTLKASKESR